MRSLRLSIASALAMVLIILPTASPAAHIDRFCGGGVAMDLKIVVPCELISKGININNAQIAIIQEGPETSPTVVVIRCAHVVRSKPSAAYALQPTTIYAAADQFLFPTKYLIKIVDGGLRVKGQLAVFDRAGVRRVTEMSFDDGFCGASSVPTQTIFGNFITGLGSGNA